MAIMEIDQVAVDYKLIERVRAGDEEAKKELSKILDGLVLYVHNLIVKDTEVIVTLRELEELAAIESVKIHVL